MSSALLVYGARWEGAKKKGTQSRVLVTSVNFYRLA
jgi:hypothetical protein